MLRRWQPYLLELEVTETNYPGTPNSELATRTWSGVATGDAASNRTMLFVSHVRGWNTGDNAGWDDIKLGGSGGTSMTKLVEGRTITGTYDQASSVWGLAWTSGTTTDVYEDYNDTGMNGSTMGNVMFRGLDVDLTPQATDSLAVDGGTDNTVSVTATKGGYCIFVGSNATVTDDGGLTLLESNIPVYGGPIQPGETISVTGDGEVGALVVLGRS